ncbi:MAG: extracellular solute-binding protein [Herpetosiphonaceae bacterium]|nr:extracellular solute-binding protein [Herpetosiphonaceae bacterium]
MLKRIASWLCCLVLLLSCAGGPSSATVDKTPARPGATAPALQLPPLTLTLWHPWSGRKEQALDALARSFEQLHPEIRIRLEAHPVASLVHDYAAVAADAGGPQLLLLRGRYVGELALSQHLLPLDTVVPTPTLTLLLPAALANGQVNGHPYGMPLSLDALVFWYDRRMLTRQPASLMDLFAAPGATVTSTVAPDATTTATPQPSIKLAYHLSLVTTLPYLYALDGRLQNASDGVALGTTMRPAAVHWLSALQDLMAQPQVRASDDLALVDRALQIGHAWSAIDWSYQGSEYESVWGKDAIGVAGLLPATTGGKAPPTMVAADVLSVNPVTNAEQRMAAYSFVRYALSEEAQTNLAKIAGVVPANSRAKVDAATHALRAAINTAVPEPTTLDSRSWAILNDMVQNVLTGNAVPEQALDAATAQLQPAH